MMPITRAFMREPYRDGPYYWAGLHIYRESGDAGARAVIVGVATSPDEARRVIDDDKTNRAIDILTGVTDER